MKYLSGISVICCTIVLVMLFSSHKQDGPAEKWQLVYKNDEKGEALKGSKQALIAAIRNGYDIKVGWGFQLQKDSTIRLEHLAVPHFLSIVKEQEVTAIIHEHAMLQSYLSDTPKIRLPVQSWRCVLSTAGTFNAIYYPVDSPAKVKDFPQRHIISWYASPSPSSSTGSMPLFR